MYIISWYDRGLCSIVASDPKSIFAVVTMLENRKIKYKVSSRLGLVSQKEFNWGDFEYWLTGIDDKLWE